MNIKPQYLLPATLAAGLALGAVFTTALRAQSAPPAYVVAELAVHDADALTKDYAPNVPATLQPYGGRVITSGKLTALESSAPQRFVLIAFDSVEKARGWYDSPAYQRIAPIRQKAATSTLFIAEGVQR
jgi:uncharacterized protein (DUF1330 family)